MKYAISVPNIGTGCDARSIAELAHQAEESGWHGLFVWDAVYGDQGPEETYDPWITMSAVAMRTRSLRFGPMITPLARRRPWKLARETVTLDRLSDGRLILPVCLGWTPDGAFSKVGEALDAKTRARRLDEGLEILTGLWSGKPFHYQGEQFHMEEMTFLPTPVQTPRIPIWVVGAWPRHKSMERVLRWDGLIPAKMDEKGQFPEVKPADISAMKAYIDANRIEKTPFDITMEAETPGDDRARAAAIVAPFKEAGVTWWLEAAWAGPYKKGGLEGMRQRVLQGPPGE